MKAMEKRYDEKAANFTLVEGWRPPAVGWSLIELNISPARKRVSEVFSQIAYSSSLVFFRAVFPRLFFTSKLLNCLVDNRCFPIILNHMVEYSNDKVLSELLKAVSDTTRRSLLTKLCQQGTSRVTDLADYYDMSLNAVSKHIKILEKAGLVTRKTLGRTHWIEANLEQVSVIERWFKELKSIWELRLEKLNEILNNGDAKND